MEHLTVLEVCMLSKNVLRVWCCALSLSLGANFSVDASVETLKTSIVIENDGINTELLSVKELYDLSAILPGEVEVEILNTLIGLGGGSVVYEAMKPAIQNQYGACNVVASAIETTIRDQLIPLQDVMDTEEIAAKERILYLLDKGACTLSRWHWVSVANDLISLKNGLIHYRQKGEPPSHRWLREIERQKQERQRQEEEEREIENLMLLRYFSMGQ